MFEYKFKIDGIDGVLTITGPDFIRRLNNLLSLGKTHELIDELIDIVVQNRDKIMSHHVDMTPEALARQNGLSDIRISSNKTTFQKLV